MRTKTLLITAALASAGVITAMAQDPVYSVNAVGYVNANFGTAFKIFTNPLNAGDNTLNDIIPTAPTGTQVFAFDGAAYTPSAFIEGIGWTENFSMPPGEAAFIQAPSDTTVTFVGEVPQGDLSVAIPAGFSLKGSPVPQEGTLTELGFPGATGDQVFLFRNDAFASTAYIEGLGWTPLAGEAAEPVVGVAEGFFVLPAGEAKTWERTFSVNE